MRGAAVGRVLVVLLVVIGVGVFWGYREWRKLQAVREAPTRDPDGPDIRSAAIQTAYPANQTLNYRYFVPEGLAERADVPVLVVLGGRGLPGWITTDFQEFAAREGVVIVSPTFRFDGDDWAQRRSYQYPEAWSGQALLAVLRDFETRAEIRTGPILLFGFSAGAQFALRFAAWAPERCLAVCGHASGGTLELRRAVDVRFRVTLGERDQQRREQFQHFVSLADRLGLQAETFVYPGLVHAVDPQVTQDCVEFLTRALLSAA